MKNKEKLMNDEGSYSSHKFRKKPVMVEAIRYMPHHNCNQVALFVGVHPIVFCEEEGDGKEPWEINTLEGWMEAQPGDWIIKGVEGECYPCKPSIFEATYELIKEDQNHE